MQIILIGNYPPDKLESMDRFAQMLLDQFRKAGIKTEIWYPKVICGGYAKSTLKGVGKWLGYIDKWIISPFVLSLYVRKKTSGKDRIYFHVCDHSNSPYLKYLPSNRSGVTCHDVLAIRGAFGYADAYNPASRLGKFLQKWILYYLSRAKFLASVSHLSLQQLNELRSEKINSQGNWKVIHNSFNADFGPIAYKQFAGLLKEVNPELNKPFLLHVGSRFVRKNRKLLIDMVNILGSRWSGNICFAGEAVDEELLRYAGHLNLTNRIISVVKPNHATLVALYNACEAFIFPSLSEGFGWPIIEAQACGAPLITSTIEPMPEISGSGALHANPQKPEEFAEAFLSLQDDSIRFELIQEGFKNTLRFRPDHMVNEYLELYGINKYKLNGYAS